MGSCRANLLLSAMILLGGCTIAADKRPADWAQEIHLKTVNRLYRVDDGVFRSAKPSKEGWKDLADMGIRTAVCLEINCDTPPDAIEQIHVGIDPLHPVHGQFVQSTNRYNPFNSNKLHRKNNPPEEWHRCNSFRRPSPYRPASGLPADHHWLVDWLIG